MFKIIEQKEEKLVIEKSKFFGYIFDCNSLERQSEILKEIKRKNLSATHVCYASRLFADNDILQYSSDDREPSGTAGLQILNALKENNLINVLCVVVRYFGGIKLGVAGLGRAYKDCALLTILDNKKPVCLRYYFKIICTYNQFNTIKPILDEKKLEVANFDFQNDVSFFVYLTEDEKLLLEDKCLQIQVYSEEKKYC